MKVCRFCKKEVKRPSHGYCVSCYQYFIMNEFDTWCPSEYGSLARVQDKSSKQYQMPICHICGKAFEKLQQHIYYAHGMTKNEYCDKFGLDRKINMTTPEYNKKMHDYALHYKMDIQLKEAGKETRFKKGRDNNYIRSYQTRVRLTTKKSNLEEYTTKIDKAKKEAIEYIKSFDEVIQRQFISTLNSPINELGIDQIKLKCALLGYDLEKDVEI